MLHLAITIWFTISSLLGPMVCCCSFSSDTKPTPDGKHQAPSEPTKSCCQSHTEPCNEGGNQTPTPQKPSKCPCKSEKQDANTASSNTRDLVGSASQFKLFDFQKLSWGISIFSGLLDTHTLSPHSVGDPPNLSGRNLLAAFSILRC